jgi:hypothetical protein
MVETVMSRVAFGPEDVANLPLLLPFEIRNPSESVLIQAIVNEQHASDALVAAMECEETLRTELQKATFSPSENKDEKLPRRRMEQPVSRRRRAELLAMSTPSGRSRRVQRPFISENQLNVQSITSYMSWPNVIKI